MKRIAPRRAVIDITHGIAPQAVTQGALVLARAVPYLPPCVHLAVVDPGRRQRAPRRRDPDGRRPRLRRARQRPADARRRPRRRRGGARSLTNPRYHLEQRLADVPRPRRLRAGRRASRRRRALRRPRRRGRSRRRSCASTCPSREVGDGELRGDVLDVDRFGNLGAQRHARATSTALRRRRAATGSSSRSRSTPYYARRRRDLRRRDAAAS